MKIICDVCDKELKKFGALLFSPPRGFTVKKFHICVECYKKYFLVREVIEK